MTGDPMFHGAMPQLYDEHLGPVLFAPFADVAVERLAPRSPEHVLELAAGTGRATRALAAGLPTASVVATDISRPMLDEAAARHDGRAVRWRQADARQLPFGEATFDAVVCHFGVMFLPDKVTCYREVRRVLTADGMFVFAVWEGLAANDVPATVAAALVELFPDDPPTFMERIPHGYHDRGAISGHLADAGFGH
ncbi:MAG TPA: class I SAM-dependent methyltransferase, partial [Jatrophihabitans sp.]|nr:class I SAM-dependent methyltransferase [Jatrophihabitans sp.]